jgi:hypothetical protein
VKRPCISDRERSLCDIAFNRGFAAGAALGAVAVLAMISLVLR